MRAPHQLVYLESVLYSLPHHRTLKNARAFRKQKTNPKMFLKLRQLQIKLDGVAPLITDPSPTSFTSLSKKEEEKRKEKKVTCDL